MILVLVVGSAFWLIVGRMSSVDGSFGLGRLNAGFATLVTAIGAGTLVMARVVGGIYVVVVVVVGGNGTKEIIGKAAGAFSSLICSYS